jgi:hypothetical protein
MQHAPYSETNCGMTGSMYWHSLELLSVIEQLLAELENPNITNEDPALQFNIKMSTALDWWRERRKPYTWGPQEDLEASEKLLEVGAFQN